MPIIKYLSSTRDLVHEIHAWGGGGPSAQPAMMPACRMPPPASGQGPTRLPSLPPLARACRMLGLVTGVMPPVQHPGCYGQHHLYDGVMINLHILLLLDRIRSKGEWKSTNTQKRLNNQDNTEGASARTVRNTCLSPLLHLKLGLRGNGT